MAAQLELGAENVVLIVCGVTANCYVETTVRDISQRDIEPFVVEDATAEWDDERYEGPPVNGHALRGDSQN